MIIVLVHRSRHAQQKCAVGTCIMIIVLVHRCCRAQQKCAVGTCIIIVVLVHRSRRAQQKCAVGTCIMIIILVHRSCRAQQKHIAAVATAATPVLFLHDAILRGRVPGAAYTGAQHASGGVHPAAQLCGGDPAQQAEPSACRPAQAPCCVRPRDVQEPAAYLLRALSSHQRQ